MADDRDDVYRTLAYGSERYLIRLIPIALVLLLLGIAPLILTPGREGGHSGLVLAIASFAYIVYACFRYVSPGPPRLALSTRGIDQRLSHGRILHIPWDEVQGVVSADYHAPRVMLLNVPAVLVSSEFLARAMPPQPWWSAWSGGRYPQSADGMVRVGFQPNYLGTRSQDLRQAIETRWRAFSRHPNAKLPPSEEALRRTNVGRAWAKMLSVYAVLAVGAVVLVLALQPAPKLEEGTRSVYLRDLLDNSGVAARLADGRMTRLRRGDVAEVGIPKCDLETTRDAWTLWLIAALRSASCTAELRLPSGERALAVFRIVNETRTFKNFDGTSREQRVLVVAPFGLEEADALLCRLGHCGPEAQKR